MKLADMIPYQPYIVSTNGTVLKSGDHVFVTKMGLLFCKEAGGCLDVGEWEKLRNEVVEYED